MGIRLFRVTNDSTISNGIYAFLTYQLFVEVMFKFRIENQTEEKYHNTSEDVQDVSIIFILFVIYNG